MMKILILALAVVVHCSEDCSKAKCPDAPKHYEEFGCAPVIESGKCCPTRFDCNSLLNRDKTKCHYGNETYDIGQEVHNPDIESSCTIGCSCRQFGEDEPPQFECAHIDCPEFFGRDEEPGKKCIDQYEVNGCCASKTVCGADLEKLEKCEFQGQSYYEGQTIDVEGRCYNCHCSKGFEDKPVEENKHCQKINCNIELHYYKRFARGCVPVYWKNDNCCPIDWRCPDDSKTKVVPDSSRTTKEEENSDLQCTFGALKMNVGDFLSPERDDDQCTICTCKVPPYPHCIKTC